MNYRGLLLAIIACLMTGCKITEVFQLPQEEVEPAPVVQQPEPFCVFLPSEEDIEHNCDLKFWLEYWVTKGGAPWSERKEMLTTLNDTDEQTLKKILLSQGSGTPYQSRLRAQNWISQLSPKLTEEMARFVDILIVQSSQERLEFESALAILTRLNSQQAKSLEEKELLLEQQKMQLEKLLKIEASMMEQRGGIDQ